MSGAGVSQFCHLCGQRLGSQHVRYRHGLVVCTRCQASRPRCARCDVPLADAEQARSPGRVVVGGRASADPLTQLGGPPLCLRCLRGAPRCSCCGTPITQNWYTFDELMPPAAVRRFCERCVRTRPRCDICRVPVPEKAVTLPDGQYRCQLCATDMVLGEDPMRAFYAETVDRTAQAARILPPHIPALHIVGRRQMGDVRRRFASDVPKGVAGHHVLGFFVREHKSASIFVELGLPRPLLLGTLAHELAHAWQVEVAPSQNDPLLREGFAEWVAHRVLVAAGHRRVAVRMTRRDDLYGRGLRHFLAIERSAGHAAVLAAAQGARANATLPSR